MCQGNGLAAVLVGCHLGDDLGRNVAGRGKAVGTLDEGAGNDRTVLEHVLQVDQVAVMHMLCKIIAVMEMDDTFVVCVNDILGQQHTLSEILGNLSGHVVTLGGVHHGVLVGVLLFGLLVVALDQA